jgi:hypothetical protein
VTGDAKKLGKDIGGVPQEIGMDGRSSKWAVVPMIVVVIVNR